MDQSYLKSNEAARRRLNEFCSHLTDQDLAKPVSDGWTVAAVLAHLAFWDQRAAILLWRWRENGVEPSPIDTDVVNDTVKVFCLALNPHTAMELCLSCAELLDGELQRTEPELLQQIEAKGTPLHLDRGKHRTEHLNELARTVAASSLSARAAPE